MFALHFVFCGRYLSEYIVQINLLLFQSPIIERYLYTVGLPSPHTLASSETFIVSATNA